MTTLRATGRDVAVRVRVKGLVQGVGFRPFVFRIAKEQGVRGWILNGDDGVRLHAEGDSGRIERFLRELRSGPPAAHIASLEVESAPLEGCGNFEIRTSRSDAAPTVRISPDLRLCDECREELKDPEDRRFGYPYINCTNCGPRYSIILGLPYDRERTTMRSWPLCAECSAEYHDPSNRRFHAQPVACHACGPAFSLLEAERETSGADAIVRAAALLRAGAIVAVKGIGGYHLACDAGNAESVKALRERKYRKERPFALMVRDLEEARRIADVDPGSELLLSSTARPIVLVRANVTLPWVAPDNVELGIMLPYTPLHELLFDAGAPPVLVMTSANRSSEPIAFHDDDALATLDGIADAFLVGERPIARRVDDSIVRVGPLGATVHRRARGLAPQAVAVFPRGEPILALGADLKNALTLVVDGQAFGGQHAGDLHHLAAREAFESGVRDLCETYGIDLQSVTVAHDAHPQYFSTEFAKSLGGRLIAVQHHRAHIAGVLAERDAWDVPVVGFAFDGTGYGDDGAIWGGEVFRGSVSGGLERVAHLRTVALPGGDAAARFPVQAAAGFLFGIAEDVRFDEPPFSFGSRYFESRRLIEKNVRAFATSSMGRLFDTVAALLGFTREQTFEGQAAIWVEHLARTSGPVAPYAFALSDREFDSGPVLRSIVNDRLAGRDTGEIARAFHGAVVAAVVALAGSTERVVVSGGVFANALLLELLFARLGNRIWANRTVPPNDGGISLGQAALAQAGIAAR